MDDELPPPPATVSGACAGPPPPVLVPGELGEPDVIGGVLGGRGTFVIGR